MSVNNRRRNSKREKNALRVELEQADQFFTKIVFLEGDVVDDGRNRHIPAEKAQRRGAELIAASLREAVVRGVRTVRTVPFVTTVHFR